VCEERSLLFLIHFNKKAGTFMGYKKANDVLPIELVQIIQEYIDGDYVYIPRKRGSELSWGEKNGARQALKDRDQMIYKHYINGASKAQLAEMYHLSLKSIERIIHKEKV
jgi:Mor family transcriptional regulator